MAVQKEIYYTSSPGWTWNLKKSPALGVPSTIANLENNRFRLLKVVLTLTRVRNPQYPIIYQSGYFVASKGQVTSPNPIDIKLVVEGQTSSTVTINEIHDFEGTTIVNGTRCHADYISWVPVSGQKYEFVFSKPPLLKNNSKLSVVMGKGYLTGNKSGISLGHDGWQNCYWVVEDTKEVEPPLPPIPEPGGQSDVMITNSAGADMNITLGVLNDSEFIVAKEQPEHTYKIEVQHEGVSYTDINVTPNLIYIKANQPDTDYDKLDKVKILYYWKYNDTNDQEQEGIVEYNLNIGFYERVKRESRNQVLDISARDVENFSLDIQENNYLTVSAQAHNAFKHGISENLGEFEIRDNTKIPLNQYFTLTSDTTNIYKIEEDGQNVNFVFRFFNSDVQTKLCNLNDLNYKQDLNLYLSIYCAPTMINQFSYSWLDENNNIVYDVPNIVLLNQEKFMVGNLYYSNAEPEGGYCRAFRCIFRDSKTKQEYLSFDLDSISNVVGETNNKILTNYDDLPSKTLLELVIIPFFYFNDKPYVAYSDVVVVISQKFIKISDSDLIPKLIFPVLNKAEPYSPIMLPDVERFGYSFEKVISDNWDDLNCKFGLTINNVDILLIDTKYWSNYKIVQHLIFDIGHYVKDNSLYLDNLEIKPFIDIMQGTKYSKRIYSESNNSYLNTESIWLPPIAIKGEYLKYFDYDKFEQYINKYITLNNNEYWNIPNENQMRGSHITVKFWQDIVDKVNTKYVQSMINWVTEEEATNITVCWTFSSFIYIQGQYIIADYGSIINNLKRNYYDILSGLDVLSKLITHDYLKNKDYTHNFLHEFTHNQITYGQDGI